MTNPRTRPPVVLVDPLMTGAGFKRACAERSIPVVSVYTLPPEKLTELDPRYREGDDLSLHCTTVQEAASALHGPVAAVIGTTEPAVPFADELAERLGLPGNPTSTSAARRDKLAMRRHGVATGVAVPRFRLAGRSEIAAAVADVGHPAIVKHPTGAGAYGVHLVPTPADVPAPAELEDTDLFGRPVGGWLVEQYVRGRELAVNGFSHAGSHEVIDVWEYRQPSAADYDQPYWDLVQLGADDPDVELARDFVLTALKAYDVRLGPSHTEIKIGPDGPVLIETASRLPGAHITDHWAAHSRIRPYSDVLATFLGEDPGCIARAPRFDASLAITCITHDRPAGVLGAVHGVEQVRALPGVDAVFVNARPGRPLPTTSGLDSVAVVALIAARDADERDRTISTVRTTIRLELA